MFSPEAADGKLSGIWGMSGIPAAAVLPSRAIGAVLAIVVVVGGPESRLEGHLRRKKGKKKEHSGNQDGNHHAMESGPAETCFFPPPNIPPLVDTLFPRGGTETQWYTHLPLHGCCMSRTHQPKGSTGCFLRQGEEAK